MPLPFTSVTVVKTITVAGRTQEQAKENLQLVLSNLKKPIKYFLECDGPMRPINMGSAYLVQNPFFGMLLRFYVFSSATGADHIFTIGHIRNDHKCLYSNLAYKNTSKVTGKPPLLLEREDTAGYLEWYLNFCLQKV